MVLNAIHDCYDKKQIDPINGNKSNREISYDKFRRKKKTS